MGFWAIHGLFGLVLIALLVVLPRIALIGLAIHAGSLYAWIAKPLGLSGFGALLMGLLAWVLIAFKPRFFIAIFGTIIYWHHNPVLCAIAWYFAFTLSKKKVASSSETEQYEDDSIDDEIDDEDLYKYEDLKYYEWYFFEFAHSEESDRSFSRPSGPNDRWWEVLDIDKGASVDMIKAAYRQKAKEFHPDSASDNKGDVAAFTRVHDAYQLALRRRGITQ